MQTSNFTPRCYLYSTYSDLGLDLDLISFFFFFYASFFGDAYARAPDYASKLCQFFHVYARTYARPCGLIFGHLCQFSSIMLAIWRYFDISYCLPVLLSIILRSMHVQQYACLVVVADHTRCLVFVRPSFMGIVFGVYRNWIWEFGDLKSDSPFLWGSIWPNTIISNPIFFPPRLHRIWDPNTMESRTIVFAVFDLTCRHVPLKVRSYNPA